MTTYYRNEYLFSEIYLQEITQQPEDTEILASLKTLKEYREFARTATIREWKESFVHEVLYALRFGIKPETERLTLLCPVGNTETPLTLCYVLLPTEDLDNTTMGQNWAEKVIRSLRRHNLKWGLLTNGEQWRMYHLDESTPYEIFLEINLAAILSDSASQAYQIFHKFMKVENFTTDEQGECHLDVFKKESLAFVHRGIEVLRNAGVLSFITNSYWMTGTGAEKLIAELREKTQLDEVFSLKDLKVFNNVSGQHVIFRLTKGPKYESTTIKIVNPVSESSAETFVRGISPIIIFKKTTDRLFVGSIIDIQPSQDDILDKVNKGTPLSELGIIRQGIAENPSSINRKTNEKYGNQWDVGEGVFVLSPQEVENLGLSDEEKVLIHPYHPFM